MRTLTTVRSSLVLRDFRYLAVAANALQYFAAIGQASQQAEQPAFSSQQAGVISSYQAANMQERMLNGAFSTTPRLSLLLVASSALLHLLTRSFLSSRPAWLSLQLHVLQP